VDLELQGKSAVVTGASRGIGYAAAEGLAAAGCNLWLVATSQQRLDAARSRLLASHRVTVETIACDLAASDAAQRIADTCRSADILVNNAGAIPSGGIERVDDATWRRSWDLKVFGYVGLCRAFWPLFKARRDGVIINVIGDSGERPRGHYVCGSTANAALIAFTRALGEEGLAEGIRVVGINPGLTQTDRMLTVLEGRARDILGDASRWRELLTHQRVARPEQVGDLISFLASARGSHISATVVTINGGINGADVIRAGS
jgi:NAD(P)-dependent dehydrogenase (short-subunit alcohol dehydrogenase family)